jgi:hypothetical protein
MRVSEAVANRGQEENHGFLPVIIGLVLAIAFIALISISINKWGLDGSEEVNLVSPSDYQQIFEKSPIPPHNTAPRFRKARISSVEEKSMIFHWTAIIYNPELNWNAYFAARPFDVVYDRCDNAQFSDEVFIYSPDEPPTQEFLNSIRK